MGNTMMRSNFLVLLVLVAASWVLDGCSEDPITELGPDDYVVFGDFFGECIGEGCIDIYKIQDDRVFKDTLDRYPSQARLPHQTAYVEISNANYDQLVQVFAEIPPDLFLEGKTVIGMPDAGDWGGFYLELRRDGETNYWLIDKMEDNLPGYLREFTKELDRAIGLAEGLAPSG